MKVTDNPVLFSEVVKTGQEANQALIIGKKQGTKQDKKQTMIWQKMEQT